MATGGLDPTTNYAILSTPRRPCSSPRIPAVAHIVPPQPAKIGGTAVAWSTPRGVMAVQPGVSPSRPGHRILTFSPAPAKNLSPLRKVHAPDCLAGKEEETKKETCGRLPSPDACKRMAAAPQCCNSSAAQEATLRETAMLKQQMRRARDQQLLSTKMVDRLKREAAGWRDKFVELSEAEKRAALQLHDLTIKVADRDDWLRESRPHKQFLQEQTAQMRANFEREIRDLRALLASAHADAQAVHQRLEDKCSSLKAVQMCKEQALREALRELDSQCASLRAHLDEASPVAALVPGLKQELEHERVRTAQLHTCEEKIAQMAPELEDLRRCLPDLKAAAAKATAEMERTRDDNRKIEEAHQNLVKSLELTHVQHEQLQATSRVERKADEARHAREIEREKREREGERATFHDQLVVANNSTARVQKLLLEERHRGEEAAQASARELEELRTEAAAAHRKAEVERLTVAKKHEVTVAQLNASLSEVEKALGESRNALEEVRGDLEQERLALARATQEGKQWKQERDALQVEVQSLSDEVVACHEGIRCSQKETDNFVESISQYLDKISFEFRRLHGDVMCGVCVCVRVCVCVCVCVCVKPACTHHNSGLQLCGTRAQHTGE